MLVMIELSGQIENWSVYEVFVGHIVSLCEVVIVSRADDKSLQSRDSSVSEEISHVCK